MYCTINIRYKTRFTAVSYNNRIFTVLSHSYSSIMASHPTEESVDTELLESARKAMKSNGQVRLINIILQVLHKRYFDRKTAVTFSGILQLLELPDMKESFRALVKKLLINNPKIRFEICYVV